MELLDRSQCTSQYTRYSSDSVANYASSYIAGATEPGVTLAGTLLNHSMTVAGVAKQLEVARQLVKPDLPLILGETNPLSNQSAPGISNTFGAALWGVDYALYCASQDIKRVFMHQGTDYRYST